MSRFSGTSTLSVGSNMSATNSQLMQSRKFTFSEAFAHRILTLLRSAVNGDKVNLVLSDFSFQFVYSSCCKKLTQIKPNTAQYWNLMDSPDLLEIAELVMWIILYDTIPENILQNDIKIQQQQLYDKLSLLFHALRKRLAAVSSNTNQCLIEDWTAALAATILQLTATEYIGTELENNYEYVEQVESEVRELLTGFPPSNLMAFHTTVILLLSMKAQKYIPKKLSPTANLALFDNGHKEQTALAGAMTIEGHFEEVSRHAKDVVFTTNSRTGLMQNAMRLAGMKEPTETKGRAFRKGTTEVSDIVVKKSNAIMAASDDMVKNHAIERDTHLLKICKEEKICNAKLKAANLSTLGITFETFGYDPMYGRLILGGMPKPKKINGKMRVTWRSYTKATLPPEPSLSNDEIMDYIKNAHPYVLETGIAH